MQETSARMRVLAVAAVVWLFIDLVRVWAPSLITIVGQAAATSPALMGAYALGCVGLAALPLVLVRRRSLTLPTAVLTLVSLAALCRGVLQVSDGGVPQLVAASAGVAAVLAALCLVAPVLAEAVVPGLVAGIAVAAGSHTFLGTYSALWRADIWGVLVLGVQVALVLVGLRTALLACRSGTAAAPELPRALAVSVLPALLLAGVTVGNPARASVAAPWLGPGVVVLAAVAAVVCALSLRPGRLMAGLAGAVLTGATATILLPAQASEWSLLAFALGLPSLAVVLSGTRPLPVVTGRPQPGSAIAGGGALFGGALLWVVGLFVYYAGYDLGYRADLALVVLTGALSLLGVLGAGRAGGPEPRAHGRPGVWAAAAVAAVAAAFGPLLTVTPVTWADQDHEGLRVLAYNVRMGYGMDGSFDARSVAEVIAAEDPDVVLLSEVDRAWLLNGGQDQLALLSRLLGLPAQFGPAADPVWGDAILTDLPVRWEEPVPLPSFGAVTGAQALPARVAHSGQEWTVISTHIQPHGGSGDGSLPQAAVLADLAAGYSGPVVLGGDLNLEPGEASWDAVLAGGLVDALAPARPLPTSPADAPVAQIDHVLVSPEVTGVDVRTTGGELSDHLAVVVTLVPSA